MTNINTSRNWKYKVTKRQRGGDGKWFRHSAAATFHTEADAREYAAEFAREQQRVTGTEIDVVARHGDRSVCTFRPATGEVIEWS